jgi:hypothetical protein
VRLMLDVHKNSVTACVRISETREALHQEILACQRVEKRAFCESTKATTWLA